MKSIIAASAIVALAGAANGQVLISEVLGSTGGADAEFIELGNFGGAAVDISNWEIELWDSDDGGGFGGADGATPYVVPAGTILNPGEVFTFGNSVAGGNFYAAPNATSFNGQPFNFDAGLPGNAIENSSYTIILADAIGTAVDSAFVSDGDAGDVPNRAGAAFVPALNIPQDGSFVQSGWYRSDFSGGIGLLNFTSPGFNNGSPELNDGTLEGGTPGIFQAIPAPGSVALAGLAGLAGLRRRR